MEVLFVAIIAFAFFMQSLMGFGGGLISVPLLSLFMPVQEAVILVMFFQVSMGLLIFKTWRDTCWSNVKAMIPATIVGALLGVFALKYIPADAMRLLLAAYIGLHILRTHTKYDPIKFLVEKGGAHFSGFLGGSMNAMIGGGAPAFIIYLKERSKSSINFRADVTAILFITNIPRIITMGAADMFSSNIILLALYAFPGFLLALFLGQKLHKKVPQTLFFKGVEIILILTAALLCIKTML